MSMEIDKISFLTSEENEIMYHLKSATELFTKISTEDPQSPTDGYNFGHYIDAAINAVILRGARRMDPEHLLPKKKGGFNEFEKGNRS